MRIYRISFILIKNILTVDILSAILILLKYRGEIVVVLYGADLFKILPYHIAETRLETPEKTFLHTHDFFEIFWVTQGQVRHHINGTEQIISTNMICFVSPEDCHQFSLYKCDFARFINVAFSVSIYDKIQQIINQIGLNSFKSCHFQLSYDVIPILRQKVSMLSANNKNIAGFDPQSLLISFLLDIFLWLQRPFTQTKSVPLWLQEACYDMRFSQNYSIGLKRFVQLSGKSQEHLTRALKKYYGITPSEYINRIRLYNAAQLLKSSKKSVLDIVFECGFNNTSYFYECFKKEFGMSPKQYRDLNQAVIDPTIVSR